MPRATRNRNAPTILVVDDDLSARARAERMLNRAGFAVDGAASGREAATAARSRRFDLIVALKKPVSGDAPLAIARLALDSDADSVAPDDRESQTRARPAGASSAAGRWAQHVANACESEEDFKTLGSWARFVGVSCSSLCESCRMLGIRPRDARDFTRMLRALIQAAAHHCSPLVLLDVSDRRTLRNLIERTGIRNVTAVALSIDRFLEDQQLIPPDREEVKLLRLLLASGRPSSG